MAEFIEAYNRTNQNEGGYANDPDDKGDETYKGIARKFHPEWKGWGIIDSTKASANFKLLLESNITLQDYVKEFYRNEFWGKIGVSPITDQAIANELYDNAVNMGVITAIKYLQKALNILNCNQKHYADVITDGVIGSRTNIAFLACLEKVGSKMLLNVINGYQMKHYIELMEKDPVNEKYIGWFKRVEVKWN